MSLLFGGGGKKAQPQYTGLAVQTSTNALPVIIAWGQNRLSNNIIWQGDFQSHKKEEKAGKGGPKVTTYTYSASFMLGLCWGPITNVVRVWKNQSKETDYTALGFSLFTGTIPQTPWGYMSSAHPTEDLGYPGLAYLAVQNYDLGQSNTLGQHSFEIQSLRYNTGYNASGLTNGADPALIVSDFLTSPVYGVGIDGSVLVNLLSTGAATTTGDSAFQTYCRAIGFSLSPVLSEQNQAIDTIERWAQLCNTAVVWTGYAIKLHPWGSENITNNGVTYLADFPSRYTLTDADFHLPEPDGDPIVFDRVDPADAKNMMSLVIANKDNEYNDLPVSWHDQGLIDQYGLRPASNFDAKEVTEQAMGAIMAALIGQRNAYVRNKFKFTLPSKFCRLEPMDVVTCVDARFGTFSVLISSVDESEDDLFEFTAEEYFGSISKQAANGSQSITNNPVNTEVSAGPVNPPIIFEPHSSLTGGVAQVWAAVSGGNGTTFNPNWGGCFVWISTDNLTYNQIGEIDTPARMGILSASLASYGGTNPDTINTLSVDLNMSGGELSDAASAADAEAGVTVSYVGGELLSYENTTLTSTYEYNATNLWRGQYGSTIGSHAIGASFARIDDSVFKFTLPPEYIGVTLYMKFQSYNIFGGAVQDISTCVAYTYNPGGAGFGTGTNGVPSAPTGLAAIAAPGGAALSWDQNSGNDNIFQYKLYRATGTGAVFGSASLIATLAGTTNDYNDIGLLSFTGYTYFLVASNTVGDSSPTAGVDFTTGSAAILGPIYVPSLYLPQQMTIYDAPVRMIYHKVAEPCMVRINLGGWQFGASVAALASTTFLVERALAATPNTFVTIGSIVITAGTITPTFATVGGTTYSFAVGDVLRVSGPATNDANLSDIHITALLDRTG